MGYYTKIHGADQIKLGTIGLANLENNFLEGQTWVVSSSGNAVIKGIADPIENTDVSNKRYVDTVAQGLQPKEAVRLATATSTGDISLTGLQDIDGIACASGDRILVKNQATASENGIYIASTGAWVRSIDMPIGSHGSGVYMFISEGNTLSDQGWVCITNKPNDIVGTNNLSFAIFSGAGSYTASNGIKIVSNDIQLNLQTISGLDITANQVAVKEDTVGGANLATVVDVNANGLAISIDDSTVKENGSSQLYVDPSNLIYTNAGLATSSGKILVKLATSSGLQFNGSNGLELVDRPQDFVVGEYPLVTHNSAVITLTNTPKVGTLKLFLNGLRVREGASYDYTISGATITFNYNLKNTPGQTDEACADYIK